MATPAAVAHPALGDFVQHRVRLRADPVNIDIEIELVFVDLRAMAERWRMDRDRDWRVTRAEADAYADGLAERLCESIELTLDGEALTLIPLHDAEVELGDWAQVGTIACGLRLFYFARTPPSLHVDSELVLTDRLRPAAPALCTMQVEGEGGVKLRATDGSICSAGGGPARVLRAVCVTAPNRPRPPVQTHATLAAIPAPYWSASRWSVAFLLTGLIFWRMTRRRPRHRT